MRMFRHWTASVRPRSEAAAMLLMGHCLAIVRLGRDVAALWLSQAAVILLALVLSCLVARGAMIGTRKERGCDLDLSLQALFY
jgi:hypothetical protein